MVSLTSLPLEIGTKENNSGLLFIALLKLIVSKSPNSIILTASSIEPVGFPSILNDLKLPLGVT